MAQAELLSISAAAATSSDFDVTAAAPMTLALKSADGTLGFGSNATIQYKSANGTYMPFASLTQSAPLMRLASVGRYRAVKDANRVAYGIDQET